MAETEYSTTTNLPVETLWDFVKEMDHWAGFVAGYQGHEKQSEHESTWTLKGDVGVLSRTLRFRVRITQWEGPGRVAFELEGLNEPMRGEGSFTMETAAATAPLAKPALPRKGALARLFERIFLFFFRRTRGAVQRDAAAAAAGAAVARMSFRLRLEPGGPMAPMIDAMIRPAMTVAAEDLANRILARVEALHAGTK